ncbi:ribonuclease III [Clostridium sp. 'deep sea']|uniref:ribonuclease III n=1 Tax=Clostridium sp. 'deep sea' TaxID=2779445 RepID=UPI00189698E9|nr:ribonuclease III [Clostridium sp. 'deep sea']QOR36076.1 ribonuclease III [Clostridium sp. 'deep sea']
MNRSKQLTKLVENNLGIKFNNTQLLQEALTHKSYAFEHDLDFSYERLEFLGDAVLELVISEELYKRYHSFTEGQLTRLRANIVRQKSLVKIARQLNLSTLVLLGKGEKLAGGEERKSLLADILEAIIGALYLDQGFITAKSFILKNFVDAIEVTNKGMLDDYKTRLQELLQSKSTSVKIAYKLLSSEGPDHNKKFTVGLYINGIFKTSGEGKSKKAAEQQAAGVMLNRIKSGEEIGL